MCHAYHDCGACFLSCLVSTWHSSLRGGVLGRTHALPGAVGVRKSRFSYSYTQLHLPFLAVNLIKLWNVVTGTLRYASLKGHAVPSPEIRRDSRPDINSLTLLPRLRLQVFPLPCLYMHRRRNCLTPALARCLPLSLCMHTCHPSRSSGGVRFMERGLSLFPTLKEAQFPRLRVTFHGGSPLFGMYCGAPPGFNPAKRQRVQPCEPPSRCS